MNQEDQKANDEPLGLYWQALFTHMSREHGLILLESEMDEIAAIIDQCRKDGAV